jgi:hypothetical protein
MTKQDIQQQIKDLQNELYQNSYSYDQKTIKTKKRQIRKLTQKLQSMAQELVPGAVVSLEDFVLGIKAYTGKSNQPEQDFIDNLPYRLRESGEVDLLKEMLQYQQGAQSVYNYFNRNYDLISVSRQTLQEDREEVQSSNIYDKMCAKTMTTYRTEFKVLVRYNQEPVTIYREFTKNTTLSMSDVRAFM